jgi:hypothetical protein
MAFAFRVFEAVEMALYKASGDILEPKLTHIFC